MVIVHGITKKGQRIPSRDLDVSEQRMATCPEEAAMNWREVKREMLRNPEVAREYEALDPEYRLTRSIIAQRLAKGLSQRQLAKLIGTRQPVISRLESGATKPSLSLLERVAEALDASLVVRIEPR